MAAPRRAVANTLRRVVVHAGNTTARPLFNASPCQSPRPVAALYRHGATVHPRWYSAGQKPAPPESTQWSFDQVKESLDSPNGPVVLIDVREPHELFETGKIPGAINIPITSAVQSFHISEADFQAMYGFPRPARSDPVVFYCKAGVRARAAAGLAAHAGWRNVGDYRGSWLEWERNGGPVEPVKPPSGGEASPVFRQSKTVTRPSGGEAPPVAKQSKPTPAKDSAAERSEQQRRKKNEELEAKKSNAAKAMFDKFVAKKAQATPSRPDNHEVAREAKRAKLVAERQEREKKLLLSWKTARIQADKKKASATPSPWWSTSKDDPWADFDEPVKPSKSSKSSKSRKKSSGKKRSASASKKASQPKVPADSVWAKLSVGRRD